MRHTVMGSSIYVLSAVAAPPAAGQVGVASFDLSIPSEDMARALSDVGRLTGRQIIVASADAAGKKAPRLVGRYSAEEAVKRLLAGSGLVADFSDKVILVRQSTIAHGDGSSEDLIVIGTRLRGIAPASPVITLGAKQIRDAGQADLGETVRALPQNFNGGQNPEIGIGVTGANANQTAGSGLNLRGLGADATLTLLNGHRLAYDGSTQAVDISAIPLAAVDRIDIVPDGASALYGSDAVGGVANVVLKRDFTGLETSARVDVPTDGGGIEQRYSATTGAIWAGGGGLVTGGVDHQEPIFAGDRSTTAGLAPSATLIRRESHASALATLHQRITPGVRLEADATYSSRRSYGETPYSTNGTVLDYGNTSESRTYTFAVAPRVIVDLSSEWQATLQGLYARDHYHYDTVGYSSGTEFVRFSGCVCNQLSAFEGNVEGPLFALPGGAARLAVGAGIRRAGFHYTQIGNLDFDRQRVTRFGYGEVALPFVSSSNGVRGVRQLLLNIAGRYERYGSGGVVSPKVGLVYAPAAGVQLKASWGRSFKAPTLYQQYSPGYLTVLNASDLGYTTYPAGSTIGVINGGNTSLKPERASTWSATLDLQPTGWRGAHASVGYFNVDFTDRVQVPVQGLFGALGNPIYDAFIVYSPTAAQIASSIAGASGGLDNETGRSFDPTQVVAIIDSGYRNVTREHAAGVDIAASYRASLKGAQSLMVSLDASYLTSRRTLIPSLAPLPLAGTLFNPPRWRGRAGAAWTGPRLTLASYINYAAGVDDRRTASVVKVRGQTTIDMIGRLRLADAGWLRGTELAVSVRNLFDALPTAIATSYAYATPYDSTNYSAVGRVVGVELSRRW